MPSHDREAAADCFQRAYEAQMNGDLDTAIDLYRQSIRLSPTAEAHTFLGWTYSFQGRLDEAIEECKKAIGVDPSFGNPYNDIGAYLLQMGRVEEAIPWLEKATKATRYEAPHFPHFNLGRAYVAKEMFSSALREFEDAVALRPDYEAAAQAVSVIKRRLN